MVEYNTKPNNVNQSLLKKSRHRTSKPSTSSRLSFPLICFFSKFWEIKKLIPISSNIFRYIWSFSLVSTVFFNIPWTFFQAWSWYGFLTDISAHIIITKGTSIVIIKGWMFSNWSHKVYLKPHVYKEETSATGLVSCKIG